MKRPRCQTCKEWFDASLCKECRWLDETVEELRKDIRGNAYLLGVGELDGLQGCNLIQDAATKLSERAYQLRQSGYQEGFADCKKIVETGGKP